MRADGLPDILYGKNGIHCMRPWNKIFSLQFFTAAGSKTHFKMRQSFVPGPGHTQLLCTIFSRKRYDGMQIFYVLAPKRSCGAVEAALSLTLLLTHTSLM